MTLISVASSRVRYSYVLLLGARHGFADQVRQRMIGEVQRLGVDRLEADRDEMLPRFGGLVRLCRQLRRWHTERQRNEKRDAAAHIHRVTYASG